MDRRGLLAAAALVTACGGGGDAPTRPGVLAMYGNSLGTGYLQAHNPSGQERLPIPPARLLSELTGRAVLDYSANGATARALLEGAATMSIGPYAQHVKQLPADVVVFWLGGVEAVFGGAVDAFQRDLQQLCDLTLQAGKFAVLVETYHLPHFAPALADINAAIHAVARAINLPLARVRDLPVTLADGIHPDAAFSAAHVARIAAAVKGLT